MTDIVKPMIVTCFCGEDEKSGNPAGVYIDSIFDDEAKQQIACQLNLPVTVFVSNSKSSIPSIEYFYPNKKMPLCLHGTLAAAYALFGGLEQKSIQFTLASGKILTLNIDKNQMIQVEVIAEAVVQQPLLSSSLISLLLNVNKVDIANNLPFMVASVGSPKLLIPIASAEMLEKLSPNYSEIEKWSIKNKVNGIYAYSRDVNALNSFQARGFNPITGHNEDAATGVAAAALAYALKKSITVKQGSALGIPCCIDVRYENQVSLWVGGKVGFRSITSK